MSNLDIGRPLVCQQALESIPEISLKVGEVVHVLDQVDGKFLLKERPEGGFYPEHLFAQYHPVFIKGEQIICMHAWSHPGNSDYVKVGQRYTCGYFENIKDSELILIERPEGGHYPSFWFRSVGPQKLLDVANHVVGNKVLCLHTFKTSEKTAVENGNYYTVAEFGTKGLRLLERADGGWYPAKWFHNLGTAESEIIHEAEGLVGALDITEDAVHSAMNLSR